MALIETSYLKRRLLAIYTFLGLVFGCSIYLPLLLYDGWLDARIVNYSIFYGVRFIYDPYLSKDILGLVYAAMIIGPLLMSGDRHIRLFGLIVFASGLFAGFFYYHAFISVWCFFAGIVSLYIVYILGRVSFLQPTGK